MPPAAPDQPAATPQAPPNTQPAPETAAAGTPPATTPPAATAAPTPEPPPSETPKAELPKASAPRPVAAVTFPVAIISSPGGATATLDGRPDTACHAPCSLPAAQGRHTIAITLPGYQVEHRDVEIGTGPIELPPVILHAIGGTVMVSSDPPGASITVDGRKLTQLTPAALTLAPGTYHITVEKGGRQGARTVDVRNGVINYLKVVLGQ